MEQTLMDKLTILADSAKYDVACTSSGASRPARPAPSTAATASTAAPTISPAPPLRPGNWQN